MRGPKDRLGGKRLSLEGDEDASRPLEPVLLEKSVLTELSELIDRLEDSRAIGEITKRHGQTLIDRLTKTQDAVVPGGVALLIRTGLGIASRPNVGATSSFTGATRVPVVCERHPAVRKR